MIVENAGSEISSGSDAPVGAEPAAAPSAPAVEPVPGSEGAPVSADGGIVPAAYQVNPTFKVRHLEKKFDDFILPHIKDADTEKKVRELYEKAHGLEFVKTDRERLQGDLQTYKQQMSQIEPTLNTVNQIVHHRDQENFTAMFNALGVPPQKIFQWAYQYANKTPDARQAEERAGMSAMEAYNANHQMTAQQQQTSQQASEFKNREYEMITRYDPQVSSAVSDFDTQHGPGAFFEQVKRTGLYHWQVNNRDISVQDAIQEVLKLTGRGGQPQSQVNQGMQPQAAAPQTLQPAASPQAQASKPVIPSLKGNGSSPVKRVVSSFADARKLARELSAGNE